MYEPWHMMVTLKPSQKEKCVHIRMNVIHYEFECGLPFIQLAVT